MDKYSEAPTTTTPVDQETTPETGLRSRMQERARKAKVPALILIGALGLGLGACEKGSDDEAPAPTPTEITQTDETPTATPEAPANDHEQDPNTTTWSQVMKNIASNFGDVETDQDKEALRLLERFDEPIDTPIPEDSDRFRNYYIPDTEDGVGPKGNIVLDRDAVRVIELRSFTDKYAVSNSIDSVIGNNEAFNLLLEDLINQMIKAGDPATVNLESIDNSDEKHDYDETAALEDLRMLAGNALQSGTDIGMSPDTMRFRLCPAKMGQLNELASPDGQLEPDQYNADFLNNECDGPSRYNTDYSDIWDPYDDETGFFPSAVITGVLDDPENPQAGSFSFRLHTNSDLTRRVDAGGEHENEVGFSNAFDQTDLGLVLPPKYRPADGGVGVGESELPANQDAEIDGNYDESPGSGENPGGEPELLEDGPPMGFDPPGGPDDYGDSDDNGAPFDGEYSVPDFDEVGS